MSQSAESIPPESESPSISRVTQQVLTVWLALTLFGLYFITYSGGFESSDGVSIYSVTESIAKRGAFDSSPFIWDRWTAGYQDAQGDYGVDGNLYSKKGLGASMFAAPLTWIALHVPGVRLVQATYLFNMIVSALTAAVLFLYALRLGCSRDAALLTGGLFGAATLAWPYAGYFYSEPLMGLFLVLGAYWTLAYVQEGRWMYLLGGGLAIGWAVVTRLTNAPLVPFYYAYVLGPGVVTAIRGRRRGDPMWSPSLGREGAGRPHRVAPTPSPDADSQGGGATAAAGGWVREAVILSVGVGACLAIIGLYNFLRFQTPFRSGYAETVGFWTPLWEGLYGLLLSPQKSLFLFAPILIVAPLSLPLFLRRHLREGLLLLALIAIPTVTFAKWMDWEGGLAWGPRYLVSLGPLWMLLAAPGLDWVLHARWPFKAALGLLAAWSVSIQALGASLNFGHYLRVIRALEATWTGFPWAVSPPIAPFVFSPSIISLDLIHPAWFRLDEAGAIQIAWGPLAASVALLLAAGAVLWALRTRPLGPKQSRAQGGWVAAALCIVGVAGAVLVSGYNLHAYAGEPDRGAGDDYVALVDYLDRNAVRGDVLLVSSHVYMGFFMNYTRAPLEWYNLLSKTDDPSPDEEALMARLLARGGRVWLAIDRTAALGLPRPAEKWLTQHAYKIEDTKFSEYCRLLLYSTAAAPDPQSARHPLDLDLGHGVQLAGVDVGAGSDLNALRPGDALWFSLLWRGNLVIRNDPGHGPDADLTVFAQLLDAQNKVVWQSDRAPADGFRPTHGWLPGERIRDNYGLRLPVDLGPGRYRLIAGMYDPRTLQRLPMTGATGDPRGDSVEVAEVGCGG